MLKLTFCKIRLFLFICLLGLQINCQTRQAFEDIPNNTNPKISEPDKTDEMIKQLFVDSGLGEGDGKLEELMTFPKERIINVVQKLKENALSENDEQYFNESTNENLKIKSAYFLWELGVEKNINEKYIVEIAKNTDFRKNTALDYLMILVSKGKKEHLPLIFKDALEWDGAYLYIQWNFYNELENSPKPFLLYLSKEPFRIRKRIYEVLTLKGETYDEERFEKIKAIIKNLKKDKEMKNAAEEFLRETGKMP